MRLEDFQKTAKDLSEYIISTPTVYSSVFSELAKSKIYLKLENLQLTGSFKIRGALTKLNHLSQSDLDKGILAASAGNHAQGVALASRIKGAKCTIVMPETTPLSKIRGTQRLGAEVILCGNTYDDAFNKAMELQTQKNYTYVHAYDDESIILGQGTVGLEIIEQCKGVDTIIVPVGGGGLISGIAKSAKMLNPNLRIIGVETESAISLKKSIQRGQRMPTELKKTMADGIAVKQIGEANYTILKELLDEVVTVTELETANAIMRLLETEKILVEGAGAVGIAAVINDYISMKENEKVVCVISGGNIDLNFLSRIINKGMESDGRLFQFKVKVPDDPGILASIAKLIGQKGANILEINHQRVFSNTRLNETILSFNLETKGFDQVDEILNEIKAQGLELMTN
ncbi:MAG: threonine ammonia-lyase [Halobacteriovoraceae bacterium]|nr:threonine ammonia-lyase [Halobacteriovoraceae bacterium]